MTDRLADVTLRILGARKNLTGTGDGESLQNIDTTELPDGAACWVTASLSDFALHKYDNTTAPDNINVVRPASGPGRWFIQANTGTTGFQVENMVGLVLPQRPLLQTEGLHPVDTGTAIQLVDGEVDALAYPSLSAAVAANTGRTIVLINGTHALDASLLDATVTLKFRQGAVLNVPASRTISPHVDLSQGGVIVPAAGVTVTHTGAVLAPDTAQVWDLSAAGSTVLFASGAVAELYAEWFGVSPATSSTDNVTLLNTVIQIASASSIGSVRFGAGTFNFDGQINFANGTMLSGAGWGSKFVSLGPDTGTILLYSGTGVCLNMSGAGGSPTGQIEKCVLRGLTIKGPGKTVAGTVGLKQWHTRNATVRNVYVEGFEQGIWNGRTVNSDIDYANVYDVVFVNSCLWGVNGDADLTDPNHPVAGTAGALAFCDFYACTVRNCGLAGVGAAYVGAFSATWTGGFIGGNSCTGIKLLGAQNCAILAVKLENSGYKGTISAVTPNGTAPPVVTLTGVSLGNWSLRIECQLGGAHGTATYRFSTDGGANWSSDITTDATPGTAVGLIDPGASALVGENGNTGLYIAFAAGTFDADNVWTATTTGNPSYDILVTDTTNDGLGANSQSVAIIGTGVANSSTTFGRRGAIKVENCDNYTILACQPATASGRDSSSLIGIEIASSAKGFLGPCHYEGFSGSKVKISAPASNNTIQDESANHLTRFRRLGTLVTDEIAEALLATGDTIPRYKLQVDGKMFWGDGSSSADTTFRRKAAGLQELLGALELIGTAYLRLPLVANSAPLTRSIFVDTADDILKFKDNTSVVYELSRQFAMPTLGGLVLDLDGDVAIAGSAGTFTWADQSGNANNGLAFAGSLGLTSAPGAAFNNHTVVLFNGANDGVTADAAAAAFSGSGKPAYLVTVAQLVTTPTPGAVWCFGSSASVRPLFILKNNGVTNWQIQRRNDANALVTATGGVPSTTTAHIFEVAWDGTNITMWIDGVQVIASTPLATDPVTFDLFTLGLLRVMGSTTQFGNFKLARHQMYKRIPSDSERAALLQFFQPFYGTPAL